MYLKHFRPGTRGIQFKIMKRFNWVAAIPKLYSLLKILKPDSPSYSIAEMLTFRKAVTIASTMLQASWNSNNRYACVIPVMRGVENSTLGRDVATVIDEAASKLMANFNC